MKGPGRFDRERGAAAAIRRGHTLSCVALVCAVAGSCGRGPAGSTETGGVGGGGGAGGGDPCPSDVRPLFTLRVAGPEGQLPDDLVLLVSWSAGDEPPVVLADPSTYGDVTSNVFCAQVDHVEGEGGGEPGTATTTTATSGAGGSGGGGGAGGGVAGPQDLLCELWTSGPTPVVLEAAGHVTVEETLVPATLEGCERPVPSEVTLTMVLEEEPEEE